jgi:hypothetical protein
MKEESGTQQEIEQAELKANKFADTEESIDGVCNFKTKNL